jgi:hypothetical protein
MSRRRFFLSGVAAAALVGAVWWFWPRTLITAENFARLAPGMTRAEVEGILGGPAGDYSSRADDVCNRVSTVNPRPGVVTHWWGGNEVIILVDIGPDDRVAATDMLALPPLHSGAIAAVRRWLRL